ncbi:hypothetical protein K438DRAFT_2013929 [Mycena galopus ATCC 62051]|nr:hypothetical protein K438DRAFT_2013929 [Mycena galopus ATCC 62051]
MEKSPPPSCPTFAPVLDPKPAAMPGAWPPTPPRLFKRTRNSTFSRFASTTSPLAKALPCTAKSVLHFLRTLGKRPHARTHSSYPHSTCIDDILACIRFHRYYRSVARTQFQHFLFEPLADAGLLFVYVGFNIIALYALTYFFRIRTTSIFAIFKKRKAST